MRQSNLVQWMGVLLIAFLAVFNVASANNETSSLAVRSKIEALHRYYKNNILKVRDLQPNKPHTKLANSGSAIISQEEPTEDLDDFECLLGYGHLPDYMFLAVDSHGNIYLSNLRGEGVEQYSKDGQYTRKLRVNMIPLGVAVDQNDYVYVFDVFDLEWGFVKFDSRGRRSRRDFFLHFPFDVDMKYGFPGKFQINSQGEFNVATIPYYEDYEGKSLMVRDSYILRFSQRGDFLNTVVAYPRSVAVLGSSFAVLEDNTVVVSRISLQNLDTSSLEFYSPEGGKFNSMYIPLLTVGTTILTGVHDKVLVAAVDSQQRGWIVQYTKQGQPSIFAFLNNEFPINATVDRDGNVYVLTIDEAGENHAVHKFTAEGVYLGVVIDLTQRKQPRIPCAIG